LAIFLAVYSGASDQSNLWIFLFVIIFTASLINVVYWRARSIISQMRTSNGYLDLMTLLVAIGCINVSLTINAWPLLGYEYFAWSGLLVIFYIMALMPASFAPSEQLARRLTFLLIGVALIYGLSEVSILAE